LVDPSESTGAQLAPSGQLSPLWKAQPAPELSGFTVEWAEQDDYILSRGGSLYHAHQLKPPFAEVGRLPLAPHLRIGSRVDPLRRALRLSYYNVVRLAGDLLFATFNHSMLLITPERTTPITGLGRPFRVLRHGCAVAADGSVWFGEYVRESGSTPLRIYRLPFGSQQAEVVHVFPAGFARHIHGVYVDPFDQSLWCLTGDSPEESKILRSSDGFEAFTTIGSGEKSWCAVSLQFRSDGIYYASDYPYRENRIYRIERGSFTRTPIAPLDGPVYYSHRVGDDLFFAVTAETGPKERNGRASIWHLDRTDRCTLVASYSKDRWPVQHFLPGTISFPRGSGEAGGFYFSGVGLSEVRRITYRCAPVSRDSTSTS